MNWGVLATGLPGKSGLGAFWLLLRCSIYSPQIPQSSTVHRGPFPTPNKGQCEPSFVLPVFMYYLGVCLQEHGSQCVHLLVCTSVCLILGLELELGRLKMVGTHRIRWGWGCGVGVGSWLCPGRSQALLFPRGMQTERNEWGVWGCGDHSVWGERMSRGSVVKL